MSVTEPLLDVAGLDAFYGKSQVVFGLELDVGRGETVAVLGRNGAGKTSTLMAVAGAISNRARTIRLGGQELREMSSFRRVRAGLALVPSGARCFASLTVEENLEVVRGGSDRGRWTAASVYEMFPVLHQLRRSAAGTLSGGERQMLAIARALLAQPKLLMLDEPSEGLAPLVLKALAERFREMNRDGVGVLITEQNHRFALDFAHRIYFVEKGQVVWRGSADEARDPDVVGRYLAV